ncbi:translesion error-prone DNA polymerase V autoproteolytic subunit [Thalassotalea ponticola]|uniref:LexA family protein n=1 Tax=Thalassotalea ponticola TaxID=1523392 RepID=UPI0025B2AB98|nr:translesion error-prone DNA polymerase V autoproteolytic subunit [Thalassotalea ponticola]MDN3652766.1 translesion error-prone DNA polymerase V autoproteolytic subunit [Thalassotalea ponticola]
MKVCPYYIQAGITGFESPATEYKEIGLSLDSLLIMHPNATFIGIAQGRSMEQVGIFDGDLLIVDRSVDVHTGDVIVAAFNGEFVCKIIHKEKAQLLSASAHYAPVTVTSEDSFSIEGVVVSSIRLHRQPRELKA